MTAPLPVDILTGFLGSGKTTLLRHVLGSPDYAGCAVLINEFGEIGLDHHLVEKVSGDVILMQSGCICCTVRGNIAEAIRGLYERREAGDVPAFRRLIIETTGLADPTPIISTIMQEPVIRHHFRLGNVVATVDAVNGAAHLDRQPESVKQVAVADRLLITKTDLAPAAVVAALEERLARLNPSAKRFRSPNAPVAARRLFGEGIFDPRGKTAEARRWLAEADAQLADDHHHHDVNRHDHHIHAFAMVFDRPLDWTAFGIWLTLLLHARGEDVLRVKGILNVEGASTPVVVHGVQHLVHPPTHLNAWPDGDRRSRLVFIVRDIPRADIEASFATFQNALATVAVAA